VERPSGAAAFIEFNIFFLEAVNVVVGFSRTNDAYQK
jgi:hypothetical protein